MRIELTTKSGLNLSGELTGGSSVIGLRVYNPSCECVDALMQHELNFTMHTTFEGKKYALVCVPSRVITEYVIKEDEQ